MQLDPAQRLAEIELSVQQYKRLLNSQADVKQLGEQAGYLAGLWRQLADWWREDRPLSKL